MKLTKGQDAALLEISRWLKLKEVDESNWMITLDGPAGSGKTTLIKHLIDSLDIKPTCCAPTGKAASVLGRKLTIPVRTVHQVLYQPTGKSMETLDKLIEAKVAAVADNEPVAVIKKLDTAISQEMDRLNAMRVNFAVKANLDVLRNRLVIIDESSMVSKKMLEDFQRTGCRALFVGDSHQLPPVNSEPWFNNREHDVRLTEIMRQALDSPIIRLSIQIREGTVRESEFKTGDCRILSKSDISYDDWIAADQVLTGSNASRQRINRFFRKQLALNHSNLPVTGDKLICLKNDHHKMPAWINGVIFNVTADCQALDHGDGMGLYAEYEGMHFMGQEFYTFPCLSHYDNAAVELGRDMRNGMFECDFAWAITCHKSQGSEWDNVLVADDLMQFDNLKFRRKWLYAAITRAKQKMTLVR